MKANLERLNESMDRVKINLEAENEDEKKMLANIIRRNGIRSLIPSAVQASVKMTPPVRMEIVL